MPKSKIILALGFFIALLPVLGFPHSWESFFQVVSGLGIVMLSIMISVDKRLTQKSKAERRQLRRRTQIDVELGETPAVFGRRASDIPVERKRVVRIGRRATDVVEVEKAPEPTVENNSVAGS